MLAIVLALAFFLRVQDYAHTPPLTDNQDEVDWAWTGLGLITKGEPYGWSNLRIYQDRLTVRANGTTYQVAHPFLDHPPLFGLTVGGLAWLEGARDLPDVTTAMTRPVPIALGVLSILLLYLLARSLLGPPAAMAGAALMATAPALVLMQRQVEAESMLAPMLLGALLLLRRILGGGPRPWSVALLLLLCFLAPLVKVPGVILAGTALVVLVTRRRWSLGMASLVAGVAGVAAYFLYGALFDWHLFQGVVAESETRRYGVMGVYEFIAAPAGPSGAVRHLRDGWWLLGWVMVGWLITRTRDLRHDLLLWPVLGYALVIMLFAEGVQDYGWFRLTVYPLLYALAGVVVWEAIVRPSATALLAALTLGGATATTAWLMAGNSAERAAHAQSWAPSAYALLVFLAIAVGPALLSAWRPDSAALRSYARYVAVAALGLVLLANIGTSLSLGLVYSQL